MTSALCENGETKYGRSELKNLDFWEVWKWEEGPFLGELTQFPEHADVFVGRSELMRETEKQLLRQTKIGDSSITIVCGSPGVGKSTFIDQLFRSKYPDNSLRISLINYVSDALEGNNKLTTGHLLDIFSQVEIFLNKMLVGRNPSPQVSQLRTKWQAFLGESDGTEELSQILEIINDTLVPKCKTIHESRSEIRQHYLAIDDVDYLASEQQMKLLSVFCMLAGVTSNPSILYTARPLAAGIAKLRVTSLANHRITEPVRVPALDVNRIIRKRISLVGEDAINPFEDSAVQQFVAKFSNGNIRVALEYLKRAQKDAHKYLTVANKYYSKNTMVRMLFGDERPDGRNTDISLISEVREQRDLFNIFARNTKEDVVPVFYVALLTVDLSSMKKADMSFYKLFNAVCLKLNPRGFSQKQYTDDQINGFLKNLHRMHLIRRVAFENIQEYLDGRQGPYSDNPIKNTFFDLTSKGDELLLLTRDDLYQSICGLDHWRAEIRNKVSNMTFNLSSQFDGKYIIEEVPFD